MALVCNRSAVRHDLLQDTKDALSRLEAELLGVDANLEDKRQRLASGWCQLEVAVKLSKLQHESARAKAEKSADAAREARERAFEEAEDADQRCVAAETRERELIASNAALEQQI